MGGRRQLRLPRERAWLLAQIAEKPDQTLRAVVAELAERGTRLVAKVPKGRGVGILEAHTRSTLLEFRSLAKLRTSAQEPRDRSARTR